MKTRTLTHTVSAIFGSRHGVERSCEASVLFQQEPIKVVLPHGEMELHSVGQRPLPGGVLQADPGRGPRGGQSRH